MSRSAVDRIVRRLVWEYPTHGFVIDLDEASDIGLKVEQLDDPTTEVCAAILEAADGVMGVWVPEPAAAGGPATGGAQTEEAQHGGTPPPLANGGDGRRDNLVKA